MLGSWPLAPSPRGGPATLGGSLLGLVCSASVVSGRVSWDGVPIALPRQHGLGLPHGCVVSIGKHFTICECKWLLERNP